MPPIRQDDEISEALIDRIAERAAEKAIEKVYTEIGRSVANRVLFVIGAGALALLAFIGGKSGLSP